MGKTDTIIGSIAQNTWKMVHHKTKRTTGIFNLKSSGLARNYVKVGHCENGLTRIIFWCDQSGKTRLERAWNIWESLGASGTTVEYRAETQKYFNTLIYFILFVFLIGPHIAWNRNKHSATRRKVVVVLNQGIESGLLYGNDCRHFFTTLSS